ncbi:helix-turn-helix transcriptional regulator [Nocardia sp. NBC_01503]|uniref:winged helix-turn-helix transcriptional regulator n=1 Tax=Nocardia sp. NBC_01503 TaxID=2975997 RepID=UPI002E7ADBB9|nr:helix-turn-helix domain-containing protein [Nocardia sp. NBC_01503]WTL31086.1 helix-turn-helix transcriptional regulator [Nocardia sp. NBC_01503]
MPTKTVAQQREQRKNDYNAFVAACPTNKLMDTLGDKWTGLVLATLTGEPRRYGEISAIVAGISNKMLTQTLRTLERDGLLERHVTAQVPVRVDYSLTPLGRSLFPILNMLKNWAEENMDEVFAARTAFDTAN